MIPGSGDASPVLEPGQRLALGFGLLRAEGRRMALGVEGNTEIVRAMQGNRCVGLLCASTLAGATELQDGVMLSLRTAQRETVAVALMLERVLLEVAGTFERRGIEFRVLKGPALAHTAYPEPGWRDFGDIDLLVHGADMCAAVEALEEQNATRLFDPVGTLYESHLGKSVTMRTFAGWEVDLHRNIAHGPWGALIDPESLWSPAASFDLGGRSLPTLTPEAHLAHALVHVALGSPRPRWNNLRDIAQLSTAEDLERDRTIELLDRWKARVPAGIAARWSSEATGADLSWLEAPLPPTRTEARWLALYRQPNEFRRLSLEALRAPIGWRDRARYLFALAPLLRRRSREPHP